MQLNKKTLDYIILEESKKNKLNLETVKRAMKFVKNQSNHISITKDMSKINGKTQKTKWWIEKKKNIVKRMDMVC